MLSDTGDGTVLYGHQLAILLSFLDEIPQLRKLSKELLPLGVRQLIKAASLQGNSAAASININLLAPNNDQATPPLMVPGNSGHPSPGQRNVGRNFQVNVICKALRSDLLWSIDMVIGATIIDKIIPTVRILQGMFPISIDAAFSPSMLVMHNLPSQVAPTAAR